MLVLVHPPRGGNGGDPPTRRKGFPARSLSLSPDEARHLRAACRNVARTFGSLTKLGRALGIEPAILTRKKHPSPGLAVALWRLTGTPMDVLLHGPLAAVPSVAKPSAPKDGAS
jgi:hypothetical protein